MKETFLIITCIACWGAWAVAQRLALRNMTTFSSMITAMYVYSVFAPAMFLYAKSMNVPNELNVRGVLWQTVACVLTTTAVVAFSEASRTVPVHLVVGLTSLYPVVTLVLSAVFLGEPVTLLRAAGILVITLGVVMVSR